MIGIYKITNLINGKIYVGETTYLKTRYYEHCRRLNNNNHIHFNLQNDWNLYGQENFKFGVIEKCLKEQLFEKEIKWIKFYNSCNSGYNVSPGGNIVPEKSKIRMARNNWKNVINEYIAKEIKIKLREGTKSMAELSREYNVSPNVIYYLKIGRTWKWVTI